MILRREITITGIVQGVGFRPFVALLAEKYAIGGFVQNCSGIVKLVICASRQRLDAFQDALSAGLPTASQIDSFVVNSEIILSSKNSNEYSIFKILESKQSDDLKISIPADLATCSDCYREIYDSNSRYWGYAFTTCTNCGPRYTVVDGMPYDRETTTLRDFPLCHLCQKEYLDKGNRRFHAQSIACPVCGPALRLLDKDGAEISGDPIRSARALLSEGKIVAVKGLGGFLLAVDGLNSNGIMRLRQKKNRPDKPFAVMVRDLPFIQQFCHINSCEENLLKSSKAPIVILESRKELPNEYKDILNCLAPRTHSLGVMLPTTPLHHLLMKPCCSSANKKEPLSQFNMLVMTSGNQSGEPICLSNSKALRKLGKIADAFLIHNRDINFRCDDSLVSVVNQHPIVWRRARGFAPQSVALKHHLNKVVLAMGAELKNTIALGFKNELVVSAHIGDLETPEAIDGLKKALATFPEYLNKAPNVVVVDLHPDMHAGVIGRKYAAQHDIEVVEVQHHHAHAAAVMAEKGLMEALALVFDGTGYGIDGSIWGGELLHVSDFGANRLGTYCAAPLLGGDAAVRQPARQLFARLLNAGIELSSSGLQKLGISEMEKQIWTNQLSSGLNVAHSHAVGRLFDAYASLLGVGPKTITYEAQGAISLEAIARQYKGLETALPIVPYDTLLKNEMMFIDFERAFCSSDLLSSFNLSSLNKNTVSQMALAFHLSIVKSAVELAGFGRDTTGCNKIVLSGGVMMNRIICERLCDLLEKKKFEVHLPVEIPLNDGGISFGQAVVAGGFFQCV